MTNKEATKYLIKPTATTILPSEEHMKQFQAYSMAIEALNREPVIKKQEPVVHAHWKEGEHGFLCSRCKSGVKPQPLLFGKPMMIYCPLCGARMDEKEE